MRVLISAVGTQGDVQPALALAVEARALGLDICLCVPPNFVSQAQDMGFEASPMGVAMRPPEPGEPPPRVPDLIADQFAVVGRAAENCDIIVAAGVHQYAARSVAERNGAAYLVAAYAPVSLPSPELSPDGDRLDAVQAWASFRSRWNARTLDRVNACRDAIGLAPIADGLSHILGDAPWLAADPLLGPAPSTPGLDVMQTGAWMLADGAGLPEELEAFLERGEPPVYVGFGSMPTGDLKVGDLIEAIRACGRRAVVSTGWAGLAPADEGPDLISISDVNHRALFPRVAAVVHHGGAGTTAAAASAGTPQVTAAMFSDQFYWGRRVEALGIGAALKAAELTPESLSQALGRALTPSVRTQAQAIRADIRLDGARTAARHLEITLSR